MMTYSECKRTTNLFSETSSGHSSFSLGRVTKTPNSFGDEQWEVVALLITIGCAYLIHFCVMCSGILHRRFSIRPDDNTTTQQDFLFAVRSCGYPGYILNYHLCTTLPMVYSCVASWSTLSGTIMITFVVFLIAMHRLAGGQGLRFRSELLANQTAANSALKQWLQWLLAPRGLWTPETVVSMCGPFFTLYTPMKKLHRGHVVPHIWMWIPLTVGIAMSL
eukprot:PhF_6_TR39143/c0_g1_i1/m.58567